MQNPIKKQIKIQHFGHSMSPLIKNGDHIRIDLYNSPQLANPSQAGKVLIYKDQHEWVSHRLIDCNKKLILKGDFSNCQEPTGQTAIWGEVTQVISGKKNINPNRFTKAINYFSAQYLKQNNKILKKIYKLFIYLLNSTNRLTS